MATLIGAQRGYCLAAAACVCALALSGCGSAVTTTGAGTTKAVAGVPSSPTLGYVFSASDGTLRAMVGVRGSARLSASIVPAGVYVAGDASTASGTALLEDGSGSLFAFDLPGSTPIHVASGLSANAQVVFAPSGLYAVVYAAGGSSVMVVSGLPANPAVQTRPVTGNLLAAVVSDAGSVAVLTQGSPATVGALSSAGVFARVATISAAGGMSFLPGADSLLLTDSGANTAAVVRSFSTAPVIQTLSVAGSGNGNWAVIANGGTRMCFVWT